MSVFSVPVTIGVDEEAIAKNIEKNVEGQVVKLISDEVKKIIFSRSTYYGREYDDEPLRNLIKTKIDHILREKEDKIVELAAEILADKLARTKAVKEAAADAVKKTLK